MFSATVGDVCIVIHEGIILRLLNELFMQWLVMATTKQHVPIITEVTDTGPVITTTILYIYFMLYVPKTKTYSTHAPRKSIINICPKIMAWKGVFNIFNYGVDVHVNHWIHTSYSCWPQIIPESDVFWESWKVESISLTYMKARVMLVGYDQT